MKPTSLSTICPPYCFFHVGYQIWLKIHNLWPRKPINNDFQRNCNTSSTMSLPFCFRHVLYATWPKRNPRLRQPLIAAFDWSRPYFQLYVRHIIFSMLNIKSDQKFLIYDRENLKQPILNQIVTHLRRCVRHFVFAMLCIQCNKKFEICALDNREMPILMQSM